MGTLRELDNPLEFHLAKTNPHPRDTRITFKEAGHVYYIDGEDYKKKGGVSVTEITGKFFPPFDADKIIGFIMKSARWANDVDYQYYQKSPYEIKLMWEKNRDEAASAGTKLHADIEAYWNKLPVENDSKEWGQFKDFTMVKRLPGFILEAFRSEWMVFDEEFAITGALDMVFKTGEDTYAIYDWKRSKDIKMSGGEKCSWPLEHLHDNNFTKYSLQLNMYRSILQRCYGLKVTQLILIVLHPNYDSFQQIACPIMDAEINTLLDYRKLQLIKGGHRPITEDVADVMGDLTSGSWMCID